MPRSIYVALPVADLAASTRFYETLGLRREARFSDDTTSTMVWSETISFQLQTLDRFSGWVSREVADARRASEVLLTLTQDARDEVEAIVEAAGRAGGKVGARAPIDMGWLYNRSFEDPDGHLFEAVWIDPKGSERG